MSTYSDVVDVFDENLTRIAIEGLAAARSYLAAAKVGRYALLAAGANGSGGSNLVDVYQLS